MARMEVVHGVKPRPKTAWRHGYVHKVRKLLLNRLRTLVAFVAGHTYSSQPSVLRKSIARERVALR